MSIDTSVSAAHLVPIDLLGKRLEGTFTAEEALREGGLADWNVRKWPSMAVNPETGETFPREGMFDVVRDIKVGRKKSVEVMGRYPVSKSYGIVQNEEHAEFLNTLVEESGAHFELAGKKGSQVFLSMKLPGHIQIGGVDPVELSLLAINSHDGSSSFTLAILPVRYACSNVLNLDWAGKDSSLIRTRHTSGAQKGLVEKAREALDISFKYLDTFQADAEKLIQTTMTQAQFEAIIEKEFGAGVDASKAAVTRSENKLDQMAELFADSFTQEGIRGTAWAGLNALTEWFDHFSPTRGDDPEGSRAAKAVFDPEFKNRALNLMMAQV